MREKTREKQEELINQLNHISFSQLLGEVFVIYGIIKVEVSAEAEAEAEG